MVHVEFLYRNPTFGAPGCIELSSEKVVSESKSFDFFMVGRELCVRLGAELRTLGTYFDILCILLCMGRLMESTSTDF